MSKPNSIRDFICGCDAQHIQKKNLLQKDQLESLIITYGHIYFASQLLSEAIEIRVADDLTLMEDKWNREGYKGRCGIG